MQDNVPRNLFREDYYPKYVSEIEVSPSSLKKDPSVPNPRKGTHWIPSGSKGAKVTKQYKVVGETNHRETGELIPILEQEW